MASEVLACIDTEQESVTFMDHFDCSCQRSRCTTIVGKGGFLLSQ